METLEIKSRDGVTEVWINGVKVEGLLKIIFEHEAKSMPKLLIELTRTK
jgi:hypothetical protein